VGRLHHFWKKGMGAALALHRNP
jgi:hypothetical protein